MKIAEFEHGRLTYREETAAEQEARIATEQEVFYDELAQTLTTERKLELFVESIPVLPQPLLNNRPGYCWKPMYNAEKMCFGWEEIPDPFYAVGQTGDYIDPIPYVEGMTVVKGLFYLFGDGNIWECIKSGDKSFKTAEWFDIIG